MDEHQKLELIKQLGSDSEQERLLAWFTLYRDYKPQAQRSFYFEIKGKLGVSDQMLAEDLCEILLHKVVRRLGNGALSIENLPSYYGYLQTVELSVLVDHLRGQKELNSSSFEAGDRLLEEQEVRQSGDFGEQHPALLDELSACSNPRRKLVLSLIRAGYEADQIGKLIPVSYRAVRRDINHITELGKKLLAEKSSGRRLQKSLLWQNPMPPGDLGLSIMGYHLEIGPDSERELRRIYGVKPDVALRDVLLPVQVFMGINTPEPSVRMCFLEPYVIDHIAAVRGPLTYSEFIIVFHQQKVDGKKEKVIDLVYSGEVTAELLDIQFTLENVAGFLVWSYNLPAGPTIVNKMLQGGQKHLFRQAREVESTLFTYHPVAR